MAKLFFTFCLLLCTASFCMAQPAHIHPNKEMLSDPVEFTGPAGFTLDTSKVDEIRIGLFAPLQDHPVGESMSRGVQLAVEHANETGGYHGIPFKIVQRWSGNPWGDGAKDLITLAYRDSVLAIIGSVDGTTTHLAEQIATKSRIPLVAPVSSDPTLTYIRLPWIYRLPPEDELQIAEIIESLALSESPKKIGVISSVSHDCRVFTDELLPALNESGLNPVFSFELDQDQHDYTSIISKLDIFQPSDLIVDLKAEEFMRFIRAMNDHLSDIPVYTPWIPALQTVREETGYTGTMYHVIPFDRNSERFTRFENQFSSRFQLDPDYAAAYSYDAATLIIESVKIANSLNRVHLQQALSAIDGYMGVTGVINWDNGGGNDESSPELTSSQ